MQIEQSDRDAAWELHIALRSRIATQALPETDGDERIVLDSIYALFRLTRELIKRHGCRCREFSRLATVMLNQKIRPFAAKWHRLSEEGAFSDKAVCKEFRIELAKLQELLRSYTKLLADLAEVEDMTDFVV